MTGAIILEASPVPVVLHRQLCEALEQGVDVCVDASAVERLSTACIQLLAAVHADLSALGNKLIIRNPSFAFGLAFEALGFEGEREIFTVEYA